MKKLEIAILVLSLMVVAFIFGCEESPAAEPNERDIVYEYNAFLDEPNNPNKPEIIEIIKINNEIEEYERKLKEADKILQALKDKEQ